MWRVASTIVAGAVLLGAVYALSLSAFKPSQVGSGESPSLTPGASHGPAATAPATPSRSAEPSFAAVLDQARLDVIQAVNEDPDNFGGVMQTDDGNLVIFFVGANEGRPGIERKIPQGLHVEWQQVQRSYTDLMRVYREISDNWPDGMSAVSIDVADNKVRVRVSPPELVPSISSALAGDYGDAVVVIGGPPVLIH